MNYLQVFVGAIASGCVVLRYQQGQPWRASLTITLQLAATYLAGIYSSLIIYRLFLHPLRHFPGPFGARLSGFWIPTQIQKHDFHRKLLAFHRQYGPIVRIGPSSLSIIHPSGVQTIHGPNTRCIKDAAYDISHPSKSLQTMRDPAEHRVRRRAWSPAFGDSQLRGYEIRVRPYRQRFLDRLAGLAGESLDMKMWFDLYSFDVMGDLTFGKGFESIERGSHISPLEAMSSMLDMVGLFLPIWVLCLVPRIPGVMKRWFDYLDWATAMLNERIKVYLPSLEIFVEQMSSRFTIQRTHLAFPTSAPRSSRISTVVNLPRKTSYSWAATLVSSSPLAVTPPPLR